jgi:hypothetical protein
MIRYAKALNSAAQAYVQYYESGDEHILDNIRQYIAEVDLFTHELDRILGDSAWRSEARMKGAAIMCPRWLTTYSETYCGYFDPFLDALLSGAQPVPVCKDCTALAEVSQGMCEVCAEHIAPLSDDPAFAEQLTQYFILLGKAGEARVQFYKTGQERYAADAEKYAGEALATEENYERSMRP